MPHGRLLLTLFSVVPVEQLLRLEQIIEDLFRAVRTLVGFWEIKILSIAVEIIEATLVEICRPPCNHIIAPM